MSDINRRLNLINIGPDGAYALGDPAVFSALTALFDHLMPGRASTEMCDLQAIIERLFAAIIKAQRATLTPSVVSSETPWPTATQALIRAREVGPEEAACVALCLAHGTTPSAVLRAFDCTGLPTRTLTVDMTSPFGRSLFGNVSIKLLIEMLGAISRNDMPEYRLLGEHLAHIWQYNLAGVELGEN